MFTKIKTELYVILVGVKKKKKDTFTLENNLKQI